ncbi:Ig-like domain repeat protein, partial [Pseudomonas sp. AA4]|nr:Ig-like domain repeat protein [Pseudomonas sp. RTS4]MEA9994245.1 Ig-like domain repeat protein [Pseudomonas sp. AA4]MEB0126499.1 Ig-like domain repeat protein [Pseudomonas sp. CCC1.2]MEB0221095.1 Ig-like domain repeat protein [Pseudomonas sp. AB12(2023)]
MTSFKPFLFPPINRDITTLALRPLLIAGMVMPVVGGDGGVNISIVTDDPGGVLSVIDPYQEMRAGDRHRIFWEDVEIAFKEVLLTEVNERLFIYLPIEKILPDWAEKVLYQLTRVGSNVPEDSVPLRVRVKLDRPGGTDKDPHLPGHSELKKPKLPQDVIDNGVDAAWAARGVPVEIEHYPFRAARDTVSLKWGSVILHQQVTEDQANGTAPITLLVDQAAILAGGDSAALLVEYEVFDEVWNFSSDWSLSTNVLVDAGAWRLDAPIIKEAVNGDIDLISLAKKDVTVQIIARGGPYAAGDTITLTWIGTPQSGKPIVHTEAVVLTNIPTVLELKVPYADIRAIARGTGDASYVLTKANGDPPQSSKRTFARVIGDTSQLPAPSIIQVVGELLDPTTPVANVQVPAYPGMNNGDLIDVIWLGTTASGTPYLHEMTHTVTEGEKGKIITLPVRNTHIAPLDRGTLDLYYRVSNDKYALFAVSESEHLLLKVEQIRADLPAPKVVEAPDGVLDPALVPDSATLLVDYLGTATGDVLTYYWTGKPGDGSASDWVPITTPIAGKPITFRIEQALIASNLNSLVKVRYTLQRAATGQFSYSATLELIIGSLIGELPAPDVLEAPTRVLDPMAALNGATVRAQYESMQDIPADIITLNWLGTPGAGTSQDLELPGNAIGYVDFKVPASVVGPNIGKQVEVSYDVSRSGQSSSSDLLELMVSTFQDPENQLPRPRITQANDASKVLILSSFTGNAQVTVGKWPFSAARQRVWLRLEGKTSTGAIYTIVLLTGVEVSAAQASSGLNETLLRSELEKLGHDSQLTVVCKVTFDGAVDENSAIEFPRAAYTFKTFDDSVAPTIASVKDSKGTEIPNGSTTFDTSVTLAGKAAPSQRVEIFDSTTSKGTATVNASGDWTLSLTGLTLTSHSITAKAVYGSNPVSAARTFTVAVATAPTIASVKDSKGTEIPAGGTTFDTSVTLAGKAAPSQKVEIFDGTTSKGTATVNASGDWTLALTALTVASHSITAKAVYGSNPVSAARTFTVAVATAPTIASV